MKKRPLQNLCHGKKVHYTAKVAEGRNRAIKTQPPPTVPFQNSNALLPQILSPVCSLLQWMGWGELKLNEGDWKLWRVKQMILVFFFFFGRERILVLKAEKDDEYSKIHQVRDGGRRGGGKDMHAHLLH